METRGIYSNQWRLEQIWQHLCKRLKETIYITIYIYIYIYINIHIHTHMCIYIYIYVNNVKDVVAISVMQQFVTFFLLQKSCSQLRVFGSLGQPPAWMAPVSPTGIDAYRTILAHWHYLFIQQRDSWRAWILYNKYVQYVVCQERGIQTGQRNHVLQCMIGHRFRRKKIERELGTFCH